jgi:hypothetical protein
VVVVLFYVKIYCFDGFKSVKLLLAAAFVRRRVEGATDRTGQPIAKPNQEISLSGSAQ